MKNYKYEKNNFNINMKNYKYEKNNFNIKI